MIKGDDFMIQNFLNEYIGKYQPITYEVCDLEGVCNDIIPSGFSGVDITYFFACVLFTLITYLFFKGVLLCLRSL